MYIGNRLFCIAVCLFIVARAAAQEYYVYVTAESEDAVYCVKFDGVEASVAEEIPVGYIPTEIEGPHGITVGLDGQHWYLSMAHGVPYGKVYKFSTETNELLAETELGLFPASMQQSIATGFLYIVNFNLHGKMTPSSVSVVDPKSMTELTKITTGSMPHGSRISPDGMHHYSVAMMSGELFEINTLDLAVSRKLSLEKKGMTMTGHEGHQGHAGMNMAEPARQEKMMHSMVKPTWVIPHPDDPIVYVAGNGSDELLEIDLEEWKVTHRMPTGKGPYNVEVTPDGSKIVVTYKSEGKTAIWDAREHKELARIDNSRRVSHGIAISPDSRYAFVSVEGVGAEPGSVDVIDLEAMKRVAVAEVGKQAGGIAFWKMTNSN